MYTRFESVLISPFATLTLGVKSIVVVRVSELELVVVELLSQVLVLSYSGTGTCSQQGGMQVRKCSKQPTIKFENKVTV